MRRGRPSPVLTFAARRTLPSGQDENILRLDQPDPLQRSQQCELPPFSRDAMSNVADLRFSARH